ncbi:MULTISPECIES: HesA/MoeB/ThiF family protein [unclassified Luteococcus]|uniref:HesA/MoeB/ThiF family protein n=1 Tax=unclassified Luteococcus TaxID=2639923 RepID=UPI00313E4FB0
MTAEHTTQETWLRQQALLGDGGQQRLADSRVLVVGCGGLGAGAIPALVAAGIGRITLMDDDVVAPSNLNRQTLFNAADVGRPKVELATARMRALSPSLSITPLDHRLTGQDVALVAEHDVVVDCTDRMASRAAISTACRAAGVPWVWAAIDGWSAVLSVFLPGHTQWEDVVTHREEAPAPPDILGATPALAGAWQAAETVKILTGLGRPLLDRLAIVDLRTADVRFVDLQPRGPKS